MQYNILEYTTSIYSAHSTDNQVLQFVEFLVDGSYSVIQSNQKLVHAKEV